MDRIVSRLRRAGSTMRGEAECVANGLRFGNLYLRARWFKMPRRVLAAGKSIPLHYPAEVGVESDFIACFIRNDYGLGHRLGRLQTIIDVGANVGFFSIAARGRYPQATIHAYEPNPRVSPFLNANLSSLRIGVYPEAVGSREGFIRLMDSGPSNQARTCVDQSGEIAMIGFDRLIERIGGQVDLLKLDCEGAEWDLFELRQCWKHVRNLRMEYHLFHGETFQQLEDKLRSLGFVLIHARHDAGFGTLWATQAQAD